jgi:Asp-tRNA(Asn)/Glu-tRNA(Gln) amidotransferase B subunit
VAADLLVRLGDHVLSPAQVREVVELLADDPMARHLSCDDLLTALDMAPGACGAEGLHHMSGTALDELCMQVAGDPGNAKQRKKFHAGKRGLLKYFVGEVMRTTRGTADPQAVTEAMERALDADADAAD